jgi:hypothetical protein
MACSSADIASMTERDKVFAAYRSWKAVNTALVAQIDAAVQGQPTDWAQFDAKVEVWRALQDRFLGALRSCADAQPSRASPQSPPDVEVEGGTHFYGTAEWTRREGRLSAGTVAKQTDS